MPKVSGLPQPRAAAGVGRLVVMLLALVFLSACAPPSSQSTEELRKEIQALKSQMAATQEKLTQIQASQQTILDLLKKAETPAAPAPLASLPQAPAAAPAVESLTVAQLLAAKDRYVGARVKVKGMPGPVMVHHKSLMLKGPQGMIEVLFGNLPDPKMVQSLSSATLDKPITVIGVVNLPPSRGAGAQLQINAEAVEF